MRIRKKLEAQTQVVLRHRGLLSSGGKWAMVEMWPASREEKELGPIVMPAKSP